MDEKLYINPPLVDRAYDWKNGPQPKTRVALDKFFNSPAINRVKDQICEMGRRIYNKGYTDGNGGNLSVRVGEDLVLCSPTLCCKGFMKREDICLVDMNAGQLCGYRPRTSEVKVHIAMMKATGMNACMHCHPPHCNAFLFAGMVPPNGVNPEADIFLSQIPLAPYATPGTDEVAKTVAEAAKKSNVVFMANHGIVCGGREMVRRERGRLLPGAPARECTRWQGQSAQAEVRQGHRRHPQGDGADGRPEAAALLLASVHRIQNARLLQVNLWYNYRNLGETGK